MPSIQLISFILEYTLVASWSFPRLRLIKQTCIGLIDPQKRIPLLPVNTEHASSHIKWFYGIRQLAITSIMAPDYVPLSAKDFASIFWLSFSQLNSCQEGTKFQDSIQNNQWYRLPRWHENIKLETKHWNSKTQWTGKKSSIQNFPCF